MKFTNKLGVYTLKGRALENYKLMQLRPSYKRYRARLRALLSRRGAKQERLISFKTYCELYQAKSEPRQLSLLKKNESR